jgi:hypothetical protein
MDKKYYNKYLKYKNKYLNLKQHGSGLFNWLFEKKKIAPVKFIGSGSFGCLICPPIKLTKTKRIPDYEIDNFNFNDYTNCNYVGKILAINEGLDDSYKNEFDRFEIIKKLDPESKYTPKLIYANIHNGHNLIKNINSENDKILNCIKEKLKKNNNYGYIILENAGITINKYLSIKKSFEIHELILFLNKFIKLLEFIKILFDNNILHFDIKFDNITIKDDGEGELCLIDFGRITQLNNKNYNYIIIRYLSIEFTMYSFEPKIYYNLLKHNKITFSNLKILINDYFSSLIRPYDIQENYKRIILKKLYNNEFEKQKDYGFTNIYNYIIDQFKNNFLNYLNTFNYDDSDIIDNNKLEDIFFPIIKKFDMYCMSFILCRIVILNNNYSNYNSIFKEKFENLMKSLLLNKLENVDKFIYELKEVTKLL